MNRIERKRELFPPDFRLPSRLDPILYTAHLPSSSPCQLVGLTYNETDPT